ncbi:MAG TPA: MFS transporter [Thermomonospora sp.]|nr:MFS transporter [Thermomonospora sp.]
MTQFILILDAAIVTIAMPSIQKGLDFSPEGLSWVVSAYTLAFGGFLLLGGRVADYAGHRTVFAWGLALFVAASLACGLAQNALWLIVARGVQGLGAALTAPAALALVMRLFTEPKERFKALGMWGALAALGSVSGTVLGGLLTEGIGWEAIFLINVPIGIVVLVCTPALLPGGRVGERARSFDVAGAVSITAGLGLIVYALVESGEGGGASGLTVTLGVVGVLFLLAFVAIERKVAQPLVPLHIFRIRALTGGNVGQGMMTMALIPTMVFLTLYMQGVLGWGPIKSAMAQLPITLAIVVGTQLTPPIVGRMGPRPAVAVGALVATLGLAWFSGLSPETGHFAAEILGPSILTGVGMGMALVAATIAATAQVPPDIAGLASGVLNTSQQVGATLGIAILTPVTTNLVESAVGDGKPLPVALTDGYTGALLGAAVITLVALVAASLIVPGGGRPPQPAMAPGKEPVPQPEHG